MFGQQSHGWGLLTVMIGGLVQLPTWVPHVIEGALGTPPGLHLLLGSEQHQYPISYLSAPYGCLAYLRIPRMASDALVCATQSSSRFPVTI